MAFANDDLSAFFFDIRKDSLYCDAPASPKRRAYRTVLDHIFHALVRWASPTLCFTAEEVWGARYPDAGSVHLLDWPEVDAGWLYPDAELIMPLVRRYRCDVTSAIGPLRRDKDVGCSLEATVKWTVANGQEREWLSELPLAELFIVADVELEAGTDGVQIGVTHRHK